MQTRRQRSSGDEGSDVRASQQYDIEDRGQGAEDRPPGRSADLIALSTIVAGPIFRTRVRWYTDACKTCLQDPRSSNGRTAAFGAVNRGSNPCRGATAWPRYTAD